MKKCSKCQETLDLSKFSKDKHSKDGYTYRCRTCLNIAKRNIRYNIKNGNHISKSDRYKTNAIKTAHRLDITHLEEVHYNCHTQGRIGKWRCNICTYEFEKPYVAVYKRNNKCHRCATNYRSEEDRIKSINDKHGSVIMLLNKTGYYKKHQPNYALYNFKCNTCNIIGNGTLSNIEHTSSNKITGHNLLLCKCSNRSLGEAVIKNILDKHKIQYSIEYNPKWCVNPNTNYRMRYDFLINTNILLEFDGPQHFYDNNDTNKQYYDPELQYRDSLKRHLAIEHGFSHYTIPFWEIDNLQDILLDILTHHNIL